MTLEEAIKILGDSCWDYIPEEEMDIRDAVQLGIEALKRINAWRDNNDEDLLWDLPGETEE